MSSPDRQHLRDELVQLLDLQLRVLEKQVFGVVTKAELREYERRHERICGLYNQLSKRKAATAQRFSNGTRAVPGEASGQEEWNAGACSERNNRSCRVTFRRLTELY
jgi:hypothetical protein